MSDTMFKDPNGDRVGSRNVGIIITDGESNDRTETFQMAVEARKNGIELIAVGVNIKSNFGRQELRALASDPDEYNMFNVENFAALYNLTDNLVAAVCNSTLCVSFTKILGYFCNCVSVPDIIQCIK